MDKLLKEIASGINNGKVKWYAFGDGSTYDVWPMSETAWVNNKRLGLPLTTEQVKELLETGKCTNPELIEEILARI